MKGREFQQLIAETGKLTATQRQTLATVLSGQGGWVEVATLIEARFSEDARCPHCQDVRVKPWGRSCGLARYRCGGCGKSFNALTGTPLARLRKRSAWLAYAAALADGVSVRKAAARSGVSTPTSFRWRHRFLKGAMDTKAEVVAGVVEADETFFLKSFKGARQIDRAPRKRGGKASKPGLSDEQVPVLVVRDRSGATTDAVLENLQAASIHGVLKPVVAADAMLVSDGADAYASFAAETGIGHVGLVTSRGEYRRA